MPHKRDALFRPNETDASQEEWLSGNAFDQKIIEIDELNEKNERFMDDQLIAELRLARL